MLCIAFRLLAMALLILVSGCAQQSVQPSQVEPATQTILIQAKPSAGFQYPYLLRVQPKIDKTMPTYLLVEPNNSGQVSDRLEDHIEWARTQAETEVRSRVRFAMLQFRERLPITSSFSPLNPSPF